MKELPVFEMWGEWRMIQKMAHWNRALMELGRSFALLQWCIVFCHISNLEIDSAELDFRTPSISDWNVSGMLQKVNW